MAKPNVTYVARTQFEDILTDMGLPTKIQSGFIRVDGARGNRLYVAATKKVGRIDISGFEVDHLGQTPHCGIFGNVKQQMRMSGTEEEVLARFTSLVKALLSQPAKVKAEKPPKAKKVKGAKKVWGAKPLTEEVSKEFAKLVGDAKEERIALIKRVAAEKGVAVSSSVTV